MIKASALAILMLLAAGAAVEQVPPGAKPDASNPASSQPVASTPALSPADSMKTFVLQPGYRVELVASEPMIQDPVAIDFDPEGRMWVVEMIGYMNTILASNEHEPLGRIVVLEDTNDDGRMDKRTVFAEGLVLPRALKVLAHGVLVGEPPNLWLMRDTNGDLKADTKDLVTDKYGSRDANVEHNANSLTWALDNWMYTSEVDMYLRLKHGKFEVVKTPSRGQWGASQDDFGRIYRNTNESVLHVDIVPTAYYGRNPNLLRTRGSYESLEGDANEVNAVWPAHRTPGVNRGYQSGVLRPDGTLANFTSVASPLVYRGDRLPRDLNGNVFVVEPAANVVSRIVLNDDGTTIKAKKAYDRSEFLAATDERFRPVYLSNAPDGTLYLVDMYRGIIQHRGFITEYLHDHIISNRPRAADRLRPHLPHRARHHTPRREAVDVRRFLRDPGADTLASERMAPRHGPEAARRARGCVRRADADASGVERARSTHTAARAVDARRNGSPHGGIGAESSGRRVAGRSHVRAPVVGALAGRRRAGDAEGGARAFDGQGLGRSSSAGGDGRIAEGGCTRSGCSQPAREQRR